jgi:O-antigen/teichoic acid export membrane protein
MVFQRGHFTAYDSDVVVRTLTVALPGFCADGVTLVIVSALAVIRQNGKLAAIGVLSALTRGALLVMLAPRWGALGAAAAYSVAASLFLVVFVLLAARQSLWPGDVWSHIRRGIAVSLGTIGTSALVLLSRGVPAPVGGAVVAVVFIVLFVAFRPIPSRSLSR